MSVRRYLLAVCVSAFALAPTYTNCAEERLDPAAIKAALKTTVIEEDHYVNFLVTLVNQSRLPRVAFDTAFRWARDKTYLRFQYFKRATIAEAARLGIVLPMDTPPLRQGIQGRVVQRILLVDVPVPYVEVQLAGTSHKTRTNYKGEFSFSDLHWHTYTVEADGSAAQLFRKASMQVKLPFLPNDSTSITLRLR
jgi:hypothetical protein